MAPSLLPQGLAKHRSVHAYADPRRHTYWDHLIPACPHLRRYCGDDEPIVLVGLVDPFGTDVCGWCARVWGARNR